jgi:hypothetical protein
MDQVSHDPAQDYNPNNPSDVLKARFPEGNALPCPAETLLAASEAVVWLADYMAAMQGGYATGNSMLPSAAALVAAHMIANPSEDRA